MEILTTLFLNPFINILFALYSVLGSNLGLAIIALTILFKLVTLPLNLRMLRSQRRMQQLKPQLDQLKDQHGADKMSLAQAQMELYKSEGVSPAGACLPLLLQLPFLFGLYAAFRFVVENHTVQELNNVLYTDFIHLTASGDQLIRDAIDLNFLWFDLSKPDSTFILAILAALSQFLLSRIMLPPKSHRTPKKATETSLESSMMAAQGQMVYLFPVVTFIINLQFPAALALYWTVGNFFSIIQQLYINRRHPIADIQPQSTDNSTIEGHIVEEVISKPSPKKKKSKSKKRK